MLLLLWLWLVSTTTTLAFSATANSNPSQSSPSSKSQPPKPIPITVLSGFLGSGKTTLLQNLLKNKEGFKVAVVVNDVASVNIDSKLVNPQASFADPDTTPGEDTILELANGCACCSQSDELLNTIGTLVTLSDMRKSEDRFQHIVIELSGVSDPKNVRAKFQEAAYLQMALMERVQLDTLVTLVDASAFESRFESTAIASHTETPELYDAAPEMEDWMKELPPQLLQAITGQQFDSQDEGSGVGDLLVSQTETADLVVLNKCDLVSDDKRIELQQIISALNPRATVLQTTYGKVGIQQVLAFAQGRGTAMSGDVDDHRDAVVAAQATTIDLTTLEDNEVDHDHDHSHASSNSHSHSHDHENEDSSHSHDHSHTASNTHSHSHDHEKEDSSHSHEHSYAASNTHSHSHDHDDDGNDQDCTHPSHSHSHDHSAEVSNDPSHTHSHSHDHAGESYAGIGSFVYRARRPFHPARLVAFLQHLPVVRGVPSSKEDNSALEISKDAQQVLKDCLRSKGFVWIANSHSSATFWSHAGTSFELSCLGQWWATLPREMWPDGVEEYVLADFDDHNHKDDDDDSESVGDRRQEVVFIGNQYASVKCQAAITKALNQCLLTNDEYQEYNKLLLENSGEEVESALQASFHSSLEAKVMTF